ncbi:unnamed protein product [Ilex paraguariensis]|uniref:Uncharacterized protein n=1 Tax=Ilex paraguariensis TaxID=185542 RepID=A0ABC8QRA0_9AQUA
MKGLKTIFLGKTNDKSVMQQAHGLQDGAKRENHFPTLVGFTDLRSLPLLGSMNIIPEDFNFAKGKYTYSAFLRETKQRIKCGDDERSRNINWRVSCDKHSLKEQVKGYKMTAHD